MIEMFSEQQASKNTSLLNGDGAVFDYITNKLAQMYKFYFEYLSLNYKH